MDEVTKLPIGKLSHELLKKVVYNNLGKKRDDVLIGPGIGIDSAVVHSSGENFIYVTTDPITASKELIGTLSVYISTNDLVATGALPKWLLINALLNKDITMEELKKIFSDINRACKRIDISVIGGHTEITPYLDRPILIGTALGTNYRVMKRKAKVGDLILMTKSVGIEGTVILSYEFESLLREQGVTYSAIEKAREMLDLISVVPEAKILFETSYDAIVALHDPTEGGIFTALNELLTSLGMGAKIYENSILVDPVVNEITSQVGINPYFLLSSGCLLAVIDKDNADIVLENLNKSGFPSSIIGEVKSPKYGQKLVKKTGEVIDLPVKVKDEIWKLFE